MTEEVDDDNDIYEDEDETMSYSDEDDITDSPVTE